MLYVDYVYCLIKSLPVFQRLTAQLITPAVYTTMRSVCQDIFVAASTSVFAGMLRIMDQNYDSRSEVIAQL